jgi:hypothetical protein
VTPTLQQCTHVRNALLLAVHAVALTAAAPQQHSYDVAYDTSMSQLEMVLAQVIQTCSTSSTSGQQSSLTGNSTQQALTLLQCQ